jgi:hypothetical protein
MSATITSMIEWRAERRKRLRQGRAIARIVHEIAEALGPEVLSDPDAAEALRGLVAERLALMPLFAADIVDDGNGGQAA